jgi:hypothetical protein
MEKRKENRSMGGENLDPSPSSSSSPLPLPPASVGPLSRHAPASYLTASPRPCSATRASIRPPTTPSPSGALAATTTTTNSSYPNRCASPWWPGPPALSLGAGSRPARRPWRWRGRGCSRRSSTGRCTSTTPTGSGASPAPARPSPSSTPPPARRSTRCKVRAPACACSPVSACPPASLRLQEPREVEALALVLSPGLGKHD